MIFGACEVANLTFPLSVQCAQHRALVPTRRLEQDQLRPQPVQEGHQFAETLFVLRKGANSLLCPNSSHVDLRLGNVDSDPNITCHLSFLQTR